VYVEPTDVEGIAEAILRVLTDSDLRKELIGKGFENVKRFSWGKTARQTLDVFESLEKPSGRPVCGPNVFRG
jgi:glycosyltransferase involved in cell wall biosynthesis